jgi:ATP-binding cassette subfamily B protein/ATP-binding cassette subfamily C protein
VVILDEPTSALDALAEQDIYQSFNELVKNKTSIYISHRLSSTRFCDKIAMFSQDGLIEYGSHEELMALKKEYYHMFMVQGKYYQEGEKVYEQN